MSASFGTTGHNLTNGNNGAWTGTGHYWTYDRTVGNDIFYGLPNHNTGYDIKFDGSNWYDAGSNVPGWFGTSATDDTQINPPGSATVLYFWSYTNANQNATVFIADITNNDPQSSGPTVTSITGDTIFVPSDTVSNTNFTLLKNGSAYANTNISLSGPAAQPPSDARGYTYELNPNTIHDTGAYKFTIDSKSIVNSHYDDSWTSSPTSGRSTNSNRILNVIGTIPTTANFIVPTVLGQTVGTRTFHSSNRQMRIVLTYPAGSTITELVIYFYVGEISNEIRGSFYAFDNNMNSYTSSYVIMGAQATISHTFSINNTNTTISVIDWVYSDQPEGDGYVPPVTTTSNGGGKPDRYPLIMTNLFNRNRSLYSIGMTHKDTWDLFE